jgi:hypothetical protein
MPDLGQFGEDRLGASSTPLRASISRQTASASPAPPQAEVTMARSSRRRGLKMPGVSTKMICARPSIAMPRTSARVVCTLRETIETFAPTSWFSSVDLPAFGAPIRATKPHFVVSLLASSSLRLRGALARRAFRRRLFGGALARALALDRLEPGPATSMRERGACSGPVRSTSANRRAAARPGSAPIPAARSWRRAAPRPHRRWPPEAALDQARAAS